MDPVTATAVTSAVINGIGWLASEYFGASKKWKSNNVTQAIKSGIVKFLSSLK